MRDLGYLLAFMVEGYYVEKIFVGMEEEVLWFFWKYETSRQKKILNNINIILGTYTRLKQNF